MLITLSEILITPSENSLIFENLITPREFLITLANYPWDLIPQTIFLKPNYPGLKGGVIKS